MRFILILMDFSHAGVQYYKDEVVKVSDTDAGYFCGVGWARDLKDEYPTGVPDLGDVTLAVQTARHRATSTNVG